VLHALAAASPIPLLISRQSDGEILYCNEKLAALIGMPVAELVGRRTPDFYDDPRDRSAMVEELRRQGRIRDRETFLRSCEGAPIWVVCNIEPFLLDGEALLLTALFDVTRRKQIEARLQDSEARFRGFVENASEIVFALDDNGLFT